MAFKEQLEILTGLLDPKEGVTECFNEAIEETISAMMSDAAQIPDEGNFEDSLPVIQNFISHFKFRHHWVDKYLRLILKLRPESIFALAFAQIWDEKFPQITVAQPPQKKRKKNVQNGFEKLIAEVEEGSATEKQLRKLMHYAQMDKYFESASEYFAVYFDPDLIDAEDDDLLEFYDLFLPETDDALRMLLEWLGSSYNNTFHLALNIIEHVIPTGEFSFDCAVIDKIFVTINSQRTPLEKETPLFFAEKLNDIITTIFLSITCGHYQESTDPAVIASLKELIVKIKKAQDIINALTEEKKGKDGAVNLDAALFRSWRLSNAAIETQVNSANNTANYVATFDNKPIAFNAEQQNPSMLFLLGINAQQYLNTLIHLSNHAFVREKFLQQMRAYCLSINTSAHGQYQDAAKELLQHPLMKNNRFKVDDEYIKKLIDSNDDDDDSLNDLESLYKEYLRKQRKMDDIFDTKETFVNAIQSLGEKFCCEDQDIVTMVAAKNNINLCLWSQTGNNELALSASTPHTTGEPIHILKQDGQYIKLKPLESYNPINNNHNRSGFK